MTEKGEIKFDSFDFLIILILKKNVDTQTNRQTDMQTNRQTFGPIEATCHRLKTDGHIHLKKTLDMRGGTCCVTHG